MKYIIDLPDNNEKFLSYNDELTIPITVGLDTEFAYETGLKIKSYAEPCRKAIEDEVWEFAWKMFLTPEDFGATLGDSYREAKSKFEEWQKQKNKKNEEDKLHVGDEIKCADGAIGIVTFIYNDTCDCIWDDGSVAEVVCKTEFEKTGRHFDEIGQLMRKMEEGEK